MADRLRTVQTEAWSKLKYEDDESARSWTVFNSNLVYRSANKAATEDHKDRDTGKGKEKETNFVQIDSSSSSDSEQLQAQWDVDDFLKAVSSMKDGPEGSQKPADAVEIKAEGGAAKAKGKATFAAKNPPDTKGKSVAFKPTAMDID
jgi:hypothetical protein